MKKILPDQLAVFWSYTSKNCKSILNLEKCL